MRVVRVYAGNDGESHFEELTGDQFAELANRKGDGPVNMGRREVGYYSDYHTAPRRQYVVYLSGTAELAAADGSKERLGAGDVLVAEDLTGHGHTYRVVSDTPAINVSVPIRE